MAEKRSLKNYKDLKRRINEYFESRRERLYKRDISRVHPIAPDGSSAVSEGKSKTISYRSGVDMRFLIYVIVLLCFGAIASHSASYVYAEQKYGDGYYFTVRYIIFAFVAAAVALFFVLYATPRLWKGFGAWLYGISIVLLVLVIFIGSDGGGAQRWLDLGFITLQPSEIAKTGVVMMLALYMSEYSDKITDKKFGGSDFKYGVLYPACIFGAVCLLVALEKHISGLMIVGMIGIAVMYMGGTRAKWIALIIGAIAAAGCVLILVSDYAQERVNTWLYIENVDPLGPAWQTLQGLYAIGSGGIFGVGLGNSRQKHGYVSQPQNDFIFTIICEELGFLGALAVMGLFCMLVIRGFKIAARAPDAYSSLLVFGLTFKVALQTVMNIAVVTNSMPNTGISLPFFSSGGTSLALQIFEMGIILSVSKYSSVRKK